MVAKWKRIQLQRCRAWILANPKATIAETMRATECSQGTINRIRKELIGANLLERFPHTPQSGPKSPLPLSEQREIAALSTDDLLKRAQQEADEAEAEAVLDDATPMTREFRRKKLEALIKHGAADHIIRANEAVERMEKADGSRDEIGPPPPQTLDDAVEQTTDIVEALMAWGGEDAVRKAVTRGMERYLESLKIDAVAQTAVDFKEAANV